jgi:hypothetical protein
MVIAVSLGQEEVETTNVTISNYAFDFYQLVKGEGFHNFKQNVIAGDLELDNFGSGSGALDYESRHIVYFRSRLSNIIGDTQTTSNYRIRFNESADYVYGPTDFYFGKDFKSKPFNSKGKEGTFLENNPINFDQRTATVLFALTPNTVSGGSVPNIVSMNVLFDNSEVYSKDITADLHRRSRSWGIEDVNQTSLSYSNTSLGIEAAFTGNLHIGYLRAQGLEGGTKPIDGARLFKNANLIDEDYSGTFSITKLMADTWVSGTSEVEENYLPCCFEGWDTMPPIYQRKFGKDAKGVFDCRCHLGYAYGIDVPLVPEEAQFHNIPGSY